MVKMVLISIRVKVSPNSSKKRKLDEVDSESVPTQLDELSEQPPAKKGKLMPPPLSPSTKKTAQPSEVTLSAQHTVDSIDRTELGPR
jgi:hypothetical protein